MYYVEVRPTVRRAGPPRLIPIDQVDQHRGFRSIVAYDAETVQHIKEQGGTADLRGVPVYADTLFMDFDGHDPTQFREWLQASDLSYSEWDSGNRSVHFHIPIEPVFGPWVTEAMKQWVKQHAPTADISFYHNSGQYRLPGTYHAKRPGRKKELTFSRDGSALVLPQPTETEYFALPGDGTRQDFFTLLLQAINEGGRRPRAWLLAVTAAEAGLEFQETVEHLLWWNDAMCSPPHDSETIVRQCESAYRRTARRGT
jgi:hypothetical protein